MLLFGVSKRRHLEKCVVLFAYISLGRSRILIQRLQTSMSGRIEPATVAELTLSMYPDAFERDTAKIHMDNMCKTTNCCEIGISANQFFEAYPTVTPPTASSCPEFNRDNILNGTITIKERPTPGAPFVAELSDAANCATWHSAGGATFMLRFVHQVRYWHSGKRAYEECLTSVPTAKDGVVTYHAPDVVGCQYVTSEEWDKFFNDFEASIADILKLLFHDNAGCFSPTPTHVLIGSGLICTEKSLLIRHRWTQLFYRLKSKKSLRRLSDSTFMYAFSSHTLLSIAPAKVLRAHLLDFDQLELPTFVVDTPADSFEELLTVWRNFVGLLEGLSLDSPIAIVNVGYCARADAYRLCGQETDGIVDNAMQDCCFAAMANIITHFITKRSQEGLPGVRLFHVLGWTPQALRPGSLSPETNDGALTSIRRIFTSTAMQILADK